MPATARDGLHGDSLVGETDSLPGWEGLPVRLYEYRTGPDIRTGQPKKGKVYLLNPSPERLARWIATACWEARGSLEYRYTDKLLRWIRSQSGGQFPVRGASSIAPPAARNRWATATGIAASSGSTSSGNYTGRHGNRMKTG